VLCRNSLHLRTCTLVTVILLLGTGITKKDILYKQGMKVLFGFSCIRLHCNYGILFNECGAFRFYERRKFLGQIRNYLVLRGHEQWLRKERVDTTKFLGT
jgi:hypothetical protein